MKRVLLLCMIALMIVACSTDDVQQRNVAEESYTLVYTTGEVAASVTVFAGTEVTYNEGFEFIDSDYDSSLNTVTVQTQTNVVKIDSNFYIEDGSEVTITLYDSGGNLIDERTIEQENYNYVYNF